MNSILLWGSFVSSLVCVLMAFKSLLGTHPVTVAGFMGCEAWLALGKVFAVLHQRCRKPGGNRRGAA